MPLWNHIVTIDGVEKTMQGFKHQSELINMDKMVTKYSMDSNCPSCSFNNQNF